MKFFPSLALLLGLLPSLANAAGICFIQYLMADNDLESFIRDDLQEWIGSPAIQGADLTSWVYFDSRNTNGANAPLPNVWTRDGSQLLTDNNNWGSYYLTYNNALGKMVVHQELQGEQDGDSPDVLQAYLETALADCVAKGRTELFAQFGSHGSGFDGFGGDENTGRRLA